MDTGVIGLGNIGGGVAKNLAAAGHNVVGYDIEPSRIADAGATPAENADDVAVQSDLVIAAVAPVCVAITRVKALAPRWPPSNGTATLRSSASCRISAFAGAMSLRWRSSRFLYRRGMTLQSSRPSGRARS